MGVLMQPHDRDDTRISERDHTVHDPHRLPAMAHQVRAGEHHDERADRHVGAKDREHGVAIPRRGDGAKKARYGEHRGEKKEKRNGRRQFHLKFET